MIDITTYNFKSFSKLLKNWQCMVVLYYLIFIYFCKAHPWLVKINQVIFSSQSQLLFTKTNEDQTTSRKALYNLEHNWMCSSKSLITWRHNWMCSSSSLLTATIYPWRWNCCVINCIYIQDCIGFVFYWTKLNGIIYSIYTLA